MATSRRGTARGPAGALFTALLIAAAGTDARGELTRSALEPLASVVERQIRAGAIPGAVVLVGQRAGIVYRRAAGNRELFPEKVAMSEDTIFDLASLTKVIATGTAVLQLVESHRLALDEPAQKYWPEFAANGKAEITVRQLLTHTSGLRPGLDTRKPWSGYAEALRGIVDERPVREPGTGTVYSDMNFQILGELVRRASGLSLDEYCERFIFGPLGMKDTGFRPPPNLRPRIAPTGLRRGAASAGIVHDPTACRMGGVAGNAGLFGTAADLARFARMMLGGGRLDGARILAPETVAMMTAPQGPAGRSGARGLAWDLDTPFRGARGEPAGVYGHSGYTGTSLWIDPASGTYVVILSNRVYPHGRGDARPLRREVAAVIEAALVDQEAKRPRQGSISGALRGATRSSASDVAAAAGVSRSGSRLPALTARPTRRQSRTLSPRNACTRKRARIAAPRPRCGDLQGDCGPRILREENSAAAAVATSAAPAARWAG